MLILGLDPSLSSTGWGVIRAEGARIVHVANGQITTDAAAPMAERLAFLQAGLAAVIAQHRPVRAAAEEIFVNKNPQSTLKLAQARGSVLAACGAEEDPQLLNVRQPRGEGPDEFSVLPVKPLEMPENLAELPPPTPGGANRTDPTPEADLARALGGNAEVLTRSGQDGALVAHASRFGRDPNIRATLAAADLQYRRENDGLFLERLFNVNVYFKAYEEQSLDQYAELARLRRAGIRTSSPPPDPAAGQ